MERTEENNATKDRFAHVGKIFSEMDSEKLQAEIAERSKIIKRKIDALMELHMSTRVRDKDCVKNRVKRAKIVRFTLC